jgi:NAD(P)-dependent dehydrogenase (short-subunit alcohol dehydrogenase family)
MASGSGKLDGKTALITGAARGIGAESARRLAAEGANVSLVGLEPDELARSAGRCEPQAAWFEADVRDWAALERAVAGTVERFGGIDIVIANAGIASGGTIRAIEPDAFERVIDVNVIGTWRTVRACLPQLIERRGYVLVVASLAAITQMPTLGAYSTSKAAVEAFATTLRAETSHLGVDVGIGYFSWIGTELVSGGDEHPAFAHVRRSLPGPFKKTYPLSDAADAIVHGVEHRSKRVLAPRWLRWTIAVRGMIGGVTERNWQGLMPEVDRLVEQEIAERGGDAFSPVGAGGRAAEETEPRR